MFSPQVEYTIIKHTNYKLSLYVRCQTFSSIIKQLVQLEQSIELCD